MWVMRPVTPSRLSPPIERNPPERLVSSSELEGAGLPVSELFSSGPTACRRIDGLRGARALVALGDRVVGVERRVLPKLEPGQWLRFTRLDKGQVKVAVDLRATLDGESKLSDLFSELTTPRGWRAG